MGFLDTSARIRRKVINELDLLPAENYRQTIAAGVAEFGVGDAFCSDQTGEMRRYERIAVAPGYSDLGDSAAPLTSGAMASSGGAGRVGTRRGSTLDDATYSIVDLMEFKGRGNISPDAGAFQRAADYFRNEGRCGSLLVPDKLVRLGATVEFPVGVSLQGIGRRTVIAPEAGATYTNDFMLRLNSNGASWPQQYPNTSSGEVKNLGFKNDVGMDVRAIQFGGSYRFSELRFGGFGQGIAQINQYSDMVEVDRVFFENDRAPKVDWGTSGAYLISLWLGDALRVNALHIAGPSSQNRGLLTSYGCRGGLVQGIINGVLRFREAQALAIVGGHWEFGGLDMVDSNVSVKSCLFFTDANVGRVPVSAISTGGQYGNRYHVCLDDVEFMSTVNARGGFPPSLVPDVQTSNHHTMRIRNCRRSISRNDNISYKRPSGIIVCDENGDVIESFNARSGLASHDGVLVGKTLSFEKPATVGHKVAQTGINTPITTDGFAAWPLETATYFYQAMVLYDRIRMLGHVTQYRAAERSVALTNGGAIPNISLADGTTNAAPCGFTMRLYRGTTTGSYTAYVDIPIVDGSLLLDTGAHLNGFPWITRAASGVDANNNLFGDVTFSGSNVRVIWPAAYAGYLPTAGAWRQGDEIIYSPPLTEGDGRVVSGLRRVTNGIGHLITTDWERVYATPVGRVTARALTAAASLTAADCNKILDCTAGAAGYAVGLPTTGMVEGDTIRVRKIDGAAGAITIAGRSVTAQYQTATFRYSATRAAWEPLL